MDSTILPSDDALRHGAKVLASILDSPQFNAELEGRSIAEFERRTNDSFVKPEDDYPVTLRRLPKTLRTFERPGRGSGYLYVATDRPERFKIGITTNPKHRLQAAYCWNLSIEFLTFWTTLDPRGVESGIHRALRHRNISGEWFRLGPDEAEDFMRCGKLVTSDAPNFVKSSFSELGGNTSGNPPHKVAGF